MKAIHRAMAALALAPLLLTACGGGGKDPIAAAPPTMTQPTTGTFQSKFGASFATAFNANSTAPAIDPAATDVPALNLTAQPEDN
jgi:hypothetical protein